MQSTFASSLTAAHAGMIADLQNSQIRSYVNEDTVDLEFGVGVVQGTSDDEMDLPAGAITGFLGVLVHAHGDAYVGEDGLESGAVGAVMRSGTVWVPVEDAVAKEGAAFLRHTVGTGTIGHFRSDADTANAAVVDGARFLTSTAGAGLALLSLPDYR